MHHYGGSDFLLQLNDENIAGYTWHKKQAFYKGDVFTHKRTWKGNKNKCMTFNIF